MTCEFESHREHCGCMVESEDTAVSKAVSLNECEFKSRCTYYVCVLEWNRGLS